MGWLRKPSDAVFREELLFLELRYFRSLVRREGPSPFQLLQQLVEAAVFGSQFS
jgi:hypothetical protein